jgi:hypothetical protein
MKKKRLLFTLMGDEVAAKFTLTEMKGLPLP